MTTDTQKDETSGLRVETEKPVDTNPALPVAPTEHQPELISYTKEQVEAELKLQAGKHGSQLESLKRLNEQGALAGLSYLQAQAEMEKQQEKLDALIEGTGPEGINLVKLRQEHRAAVKAFNEQKMEHNLSVVAYSTEAEELRSLKLFLTVAKVATAEGVPLAKLLSFSPKTEEEAIKTAKLIAEVMPPSSNMQSERLLGATTTDKKSAPKTALGKIGAGYGKLKEEATNKHLS